jgi:ATP-dependent DNA helicase DinG
VTLDIPHILGPQGPIARRMGAEFEERPQQVRMAEAVDEALTKGEALLVEAGTGVGKSFAYLLPAIKHVLSHATARDDGDTSVKRARVVISTHTIALQEQIFGRDLPLLRAVLGVEFTAVLAKGRGN